MGKARWPGRSVKRNPGRLYQHGPGFHFIPSRLLAFIMKYFKRCQAVIVFITAIVVVALILRVWFDWANTNKEEYFSAFFYYVIFVSAFYSLYFLWFGVSVIRSRQYPLEVNQLNGDRKKSKKGVEAQIVGVFLLICAISLILIIMKLIGSAPELMAYLSKQDQ